MMSLKVELQNIGGLHGNYEFLFDKGLNLLQAPNATGKSSLLNALFLVLSNENIPTSELKEYLTDNEVAGFVKLYDEDGKKSEIRLTRDISNEINLTKVVIQSKFTSELAYYIIFLREKSKINQGIQAADDIKIENWFIDITKINIFHTVWVTSQEIYHQIENRVDNLKEKQKDDIKPLEKTLNEKKSSLENNLKKKQEIIDDPINKKNRRKVDELTNEIKNLNKIIKNTKLELSDLMDKQEPELKVEYEKIKSFKLKLIDELENKEKKQESLIIEKKQWELKINKKSKEIQNTKVQNTEIKELKNEQTQNIEKLRKLKDRSICPLCDSEIDKKKNANLLKQSEIKLKELVDEEAKLLSSQKISSNELKIAQEKIKKINDEIKYLPEELEKEINTVNNKFKEIEKNIKKINEKINDLETKVGDLEKKKKKMDEELKENLNPEIQEEIDKLNDVITKEEVEITLLNTRKKKFIEDNVELLKMEKRLKVAEKIVKYYRDRVELIRKDMVKNINDKLRESFKLLKLAELERITLEPEHFKIDIQRIDKSYTTIEKMSGAERALISLIISYIVKVTLLPDIPVLLVDEVTSEMDDTRFRDVINYISSEIPYLIVSRHTPFSGKKIFLTQSQIKNNF